MKIFHILREIPVEQIIQKYTECEVYDEGTWQLVIPCPLCGHSKCGKINTDNNTLACFRTEQYYLDPIQVTQRIREVDEMEAIMALANDFQITLPTDWHQQLEAHRLRQRRNEAWTDFAEECHELLTDEHRQYWRSRGLTDELINSIKIGYCPGNGSIITTLISKGFTRQELWNFGLSVGDGSREFLTVGYYTLPNWDGKKVIDVQGRRSIDDLTLTTPRYKNSSGEVKALYNPRALQEDTVFLAEGVPDTLSLIQMGFNACGSYGVGGVKDEWIPLFRKSHEVFIAFDNDDAGKTQSYKRAREIGDNTRIILLPDVKDVNEFLVKHGIEQGQTLMRELAENAKTALEMDIDALPTESGKVDEDLLKDIIARIFNLPPLRQNHYRDLIRHHFGMTKKDIEQFFRHYHNLKVRNSDTLGIKREDIDTPQVLLIEDPSYVRLAQSFVLDKVLYAQEFQALGNNEGESYRKRSIHIVTSDHELLPLPEKVTKDPNEIMIWKLAEDQLLLRRPLNSATRRWSKTGTPYSIDKFLKGEEEQVSIKDLYQRIERMFRRYYYTTEEYDYVILSLFTLFTYFYELYDAVPYLYLNGQPETGKSTICILIQHLAFNGDMVSNISASALFREAEQKQVTLILDEQEGISNRRANEEKGDYMSIIKDAYKRTGTIKRQSTIDSSVTEEFTVFSPLVIANVMGLEDILKTRTIGIATKAAPAATRLQRLRPSSKEFLDEVQVIRDQCYCWVMQNHKALSVLTTMDFGDILNNRAGELFQPLFALATMIEEIAEESERLNLVEQLQTSLPSKLFRRASVQSRDTLEQLRDACLELLAEKGVTGPDQEGQWVSVLEILDKLVEINDGRYDDYMSPRWIGEKIAAANFIETAADKQRRQFDTLIRDPRTQLVIVNDRPPVNETKRVMHYFLRYELVSR
ncbi:toprim domain-containing protein [Syntrophomonas wolfei]|uniref:DNA primase-like protein n=1 Tax=Syntrophomonas wolfei subsp. wolfei (strain DSM 2245B / Goettingen) TaxID=335541 RepID=Q0AUQ3_SYNWW|nr:toprim domain-containing protein [Syntrophomonas wolfei]ABI69551.1 DNA primase-like protein [Syntrophomonas wolfei subsp. wolfei str. Goettingen G311]